MQNHPLDSYSPPYDIGWRHHAPRPTPNGKAVYVTHEKGSIHWIPSYGCITTLGEIRSAWARQNWEEGPLGFPTKNERPISQSELTMLLSNRTEALDSHFITRYGRGTEFEGGIVYFWVDPDDQDIATTILKNGERYDENVSPPDRVAMSRRDPYRATLDIIREGRKMGLAEIDVLISREGAERLQGELSIVDFIQGNGGRESISGDKIVLRLKYK